MDGRTLLISITTIYYHFLSQCPLTIISLTPWVTSQGRDRECFFVLLSLSALLSVECFPVCKEDMQVETLFCERCSNLSRLLPVSTRKFEIDLFTVTTFFCFLSSAYSQLLCSVMLVFYEKCPLLLGKLSQVWLETFKDYLIWICLLNLFFFLMFALWFFCLCEQEDIFLSTLAWTL